MSTLLQLPPSLENRRRAVYTALIEYLEDEALWEALTLWEDAYAHEPAFSVQKFLSNILDTPALRQQRVRILQTMVRTLAAPPATLLPDPREQLLVYRMRRGSTTSVAANSRDPGVSACASLLARILRGLDDDNRLKLRLYMLDRLDRSNLAPAVRQAAHAWLSEQSRITLARAGEQDLQRLLSLAYMGLCEYIGPVAADAALSRALRLLGEEEAELLPWARKLL